MALLITFGILIGACQTESPSPESPSLEPAASGEPTAAPVERSADEREPVEASPSVEQTGAPAAALHQRALREPDPARAAQMFERACERSFAPACVAFADVLEAGDGLATDPERARVVLEQACLDGSTIACDRLGH